LRCVSKLKARLDQEGITSKSRTSAAGTDREELRTTEVRSIRS
jgi:hypothetical protein